MNSIWKNELLFYRVTSLTFACCMGYLLHLYALPLFSAIAIPVLCLTTLWSRSNLVAAILLAAVSFSLIVIGVIGQNTMGNIEQPIVGVLTFFFVASTARSLACTDTRANSVMTSRMNYTPVSESSISKNSSLTFGHAISVAFILLAWLLAGFLCMRFSQIANSQREYRDYVVQLRQSVGLELPEAYIAIQLLFTFMLALWIANQFFSYWRLRRNNGDIAAMHVRSELWKWDGSEQRMISRQGRKNRGA